MEAFLVLVLAAFLVLVVVEFIKWVLDGLAQLARAARLALSGLVKLTGALMLIWLLASFVLQR